jgi:hypothetical protein
MSYTELKELPGLEGSLNIYISQRHSLRRPPSLSESDALSPENVQRVKHTRLFVQEQEQEQPDCLERFERPFILYSLRFTFHITLISVFESIFFFFYVSTLENNGINNTINYFVSGAVKVCSNWTDWEQAAVNDIISPWINVTDIQESAVTVAATRLAANARLLRISWVYVGIFGTLFTAATLYAKIRKMNVRWCRLVAENLAMVFMLAFYEFLFFTTIITPYSPITAEEIEINAIHKFQSQCHLLT